MKPLVSVLICAYNVEPYLQETLNALLGQTYQNLEIVLVNDGSTDGTLGIAESFARKDSRFKVLSHSKNIGIVGSLNIGLNEVKGKYIARTDSDDIASPDWIEKIVDRLEADSDLMAMGSYLQILSKAGNNSTLSDYWQHGDIWKNPLTHEEIMSFFPFGNCIHNNTMIMRRTVIDSGLRFDPDYIHAEDYKFWYEVSKLGKLANYPEPLVKYRFHQNQVSSKHNLQQRKTAQKIKKEIRDWYLKVAGIRTGLEHLDYSHMKSATHELYEKVLPEQDIEYLRLFLYEYFLSLEKYSLVNCLDFVADRVMRKLFTVQQYRKILKKMLRPWKYHGDFELK